MAFDIRPLAHDAPTVDRLADILAATVAAGGSVHFMDPTPIDQARAYWTGALADTGRIVLGAFVDGALMGTVTLYLDTPPNQPFRGEIWKLMVAPEGRRQGLARALMLEAQRLAAEHGRTMLTLDTATEGGASELYESLGWERAGVIPDYAYKPHGGLVGTAIYYKRLESAAPSGGDVRRGSPQGRSQP
jgi:ribosomal protein S18 acetylase RimI-like enzyme